MNVWKKGWTPTRVDDVIFKRHECEWVLPLVVAEKLKYNKQHVPALIHEVWMWKDYRGTYVHIHERLCEASVFSYYYRRVFAAYSGGTEVPSLPAAPSPSLLPEVRY